jgi:hypothetical protein
MFLDYEKSKFVSGSFLFSCPPTEFAFAEKTGLEFAHPLSTIARKRATDFFAEVSSCPLILTFARTFFENQMN